METDLVGKMVVPFVAVADRSIIVTAHAIGNDSVHDVVDRNIIGARRLSQPGVKIRPEPDRC
jgi:hypothetical protein